MWDHQLATGQERKVSRWTHQPGIHEAHTPYRSSSSTHLENNNMRNVWEHAYKVNAASLWQKKVRIPSPTCLHFLHFVSFTGVAALWGWEHLFGPTNQIVVQTQTLCPVTYWHVTVTLARTLVAKDVVPANAVPLGIKLHYRLTAWRG